MSETEVQEKAGVSRRRLLKMAAYSVPAMSLLNVASVARAQGHSPHLCDEPIGFGLLRDIYDNPRWRHPWVQCCIIEQPCHHENNDRWYPISNDPTFSARWAGNLIIRESGNYGIRIRGADFVAGSLFVTSSFTYHTFGSAGMDVYLECGQHLLDLVYSHYTNDMNSLSWVCLEWRTPWSSSWVPVPATELGHMW